MGKEWQGKADDKRARRNQKDILQTYKCGKGKSRTGFVDD